MTVLLNSEGIKVQTWQNNCCFPALSWHIALLKTESLIWLNREKQLTHVPERVATVLRGEVDFLRAEHDFLLDVNNWTSSEKTELSEQLPDRDRIRYTLRKKTHTSSLTWRRRQSQRGIRQRGQGRSSCPGPCFPRESSQRAWLLDFCQIGPKTRDTHTHKWLKRLTIQKCLFKSWQDVGQYANEDLLHTCAASLELRPFAAPW